MKLILLLFSFLIGHAVFCQKTEIFYTFDWDTCNNEQARFYAVLTQTDSGWLRRDYNVGTQKLMMHRLYEDKDSTVKNGTFYYFHGNGKVLALERWADGKKEGICMAFHSNGMIADSAFFKNGQVFGKRFRWHRNGMMADSITRLNDSSEVHVSWFDDGGMASAGYRVHGRQYGKWQYFHHNGKIAALEVYKDEELISTEYFDENGNAQGDEELTERPALYKKGADGWKKHMDKNIYWPTNMRFTSDGRVTLEVTFYVDEMGKVVDAEVTVPFNEMFDRVALNAVKSSSEWYPAIEHNRKVKSRRVQTVTFIQGDTRD